MVIQFAVAVLAPFAAFTIGQCVHIKRLNAVCLVNDRVLMANFLDIEYESTFYFELHVPWFPFYDVKFLSGAVSVRKPLRAPGHQQLVPLREQLAVHGARLVWARVLGPPGPHSAEYTWLIIISLKVVIGARESSPPATPIVPAIIIVSVVRRSAVHAAAAELETRRVNTAAECSVGGAEFDRKELMNITER